MIRIGDDGYIRIHALDAILLAGVVWMGWSVLWLLFTITDVL